MTRIRLDLCDYDFEILYKKGKMNTNADALSRIMIDTETLKTMIPTESEQEKKKILAITRNMQRKFDLEINDIQEKNIRNETPDKLFAWECTSISDVKNLLKLKFQVDTKLKEQNIIVSDFEVVIRCSDNPRSTRLSLEKLLPKMLSLNIQELALDANDVIFETIEINEFKNIFNKLSRKPNENLKILIYRPPTRIVDKNRQHELISEYHDSSHLGIRKTTLKLKQRYIWKNMGKMVKAYVANCRECRINKQTRHTKEKFVITDTPGNSFEIVSIDTVGPLRYSNGFRYILTMQDELTKYIVACPIESKDAKTVAKALVNNLILIYGHFKILKSDKGTEFLNELMAEVCKLLRIKQIFSTPYHHETLGSVERNHRVLNEYLLNFCKDDEWDKWIPYFCFAYNTTPHVDTNYTPFELIFGRLPDLLNSNVLSCEPIYNTDNYAKEIRARLQYSLNKAKEYLEKAKRKRVDQCLHNNPLKLKKGDKVLVRNFNRKKNQPPYHGPYKIVEVKGVNSVLDLGNAIKEFHNNNLKKY